MRGVMAVVRVLLVLLVIGIIANCADTPTAPDRSVTKQSTIAFATASNDSGLSITTDKDDYAPGDTVWFTGAGWSPGDTLDIVLTDDPTLDSHQWSVGTDETGGFRDSTYIVDTQDIGVTFTITATSRSNPQQTLTVVFTDGNFKFTTAPTSLVASIVLTQRAGTTCPGGMVQNTVTANYNSNVLLLLTSHYNFSVPTVSGYTYTGYTLGNNNLTVSPASDPTNNMLCVVSTASGAGSIELAYVDNTTTQLTHDPAATNVGQQVTFTATVKDHLGATIGNKGSVTFYEFSGTQTCDAPGAATSLAGPINLTNNPSGQASFQTTSLSQGTHVITGCYSGTASFGKSFGSVTHVVSSNTDTQAPIISCTVPDQSKWYAADQTVPCTASDANPGLANAGDATFSLTTSVPANTEDASALTGTKQVCDKDNNCATAGPYTFKVDKKAPTITCGTADGNWHKLDVSIACTATDGVGSGLANAGDASFSLSTSVASGTQDNNASTDTHTVADAVGNSVTAGPISGNMVDKKDPVVSCGSADANWHGSNVMIPCTATDGQGSGLANAGDASFNLSTNVPDDTDDNNASTGSRTVTDAVGNSTTAGPITGNMVDRKDPTVVCGSADGLWHADDVSIGCTASDGAGSGLKYASDASFNLSTNVPSGTETSDASTGTHNVADAVANSATAGPISGNKVDKKGPTVNLVCSATVILGSTANGHWTASDGGSGLVGADNGDVSLATSPVGQHTANVTKKDNVGNETTGSCNYNVVYNWTGFFQPVDNDNVNVAKAGSAIPVKFNLGGNQGLNIFYVGDPKAYPNSSQVNCDSHADLDTIEETVNAGGSSLTYDVTASQYIYVWKTDKSWAGQCRRLDVKLNDGTTHSATFKFKN